MPSSIWNKGGPGDAADQIGDGDAHAEGADDPWIMTKRVFSQPL